jgi:predicted HTH transcriptional regulator
MRTLGEAATKYGLPVPKYEFDGLYLNLTIYRHARAAAEGLSADVQKELSKSEQDGWVWFSTQGQCGSGDYAAQFGIDVRTARRHLNHFVELKLARKTGSGPSTTYRLQ